MRESPTLRASWPHVNTQLVPAAKHDPGTTDAYRSSGRPQMFGALVRLVVILIVLAAGVAFFMGYRVADRGTPRPSTEPSVRTPDSRPIDTTKARETGAAVGEKVAEGANEAQHAIGSAALT